jgi:hypothetical protein
LRKIKNRFLDTAYAATHLRHLEEFGGLSSDEQLRADEVFAQFLNLDAEQRGWGIRWEVTRKKIGTERIERGISHPRDFNVTRIALCLVGLKPGAEPKPGAIDEAVLAALALKPEPYSLPWLFLWLLRLGFEPLVDTAEFRDRAAEEYRRIRKNAVGADFHEILDRIDRLDRDAARVRKEWREHLKGSVAVLDWALIRQGIEGIVPAFWPGGAVPRRQYHHISRIPLREYTQSCRLPLKGGGELICFRQKGGLVRSILITPALEARYLAIKLIPTAEQRLLERIGRLYGLNCWFDYLGRVPRDKRAASGVGFSSDAENANEGLSAGGEGARPDLMRLEKLHEERLKKGLESNIRHAPQGGTVKISRPAPAVRHAELKRDTVAYNDKHDSYWNSSGIRAIRPCEAYEFNGLVSYADPENQMFGRWTLNIPKPDLLGALEHKITENPYGRAANENVRNDLSEHPDNGADRRTARTRHRDAV